MEAREKQLDKMQKARATKTFVSTGVQTTATSSQSNSRERLYQLQHEEDEIKMQNIMKEHTELKIEVVNSRSMLEVYRDFMKNQLVFLDEIKAGKSFSPPEAVAIEAAGKNEFEQGMAVHGQQMHPENGPITSLRI